MADRSPTDCSGPDDPTGSPPDPTCAPPAPEPDGLPLLGNTHQYLRDPLTFHERHARDLGDVVGVRLAVDATREATADWTDGDRIRLDTVTKRVTLDVLVRALFSRDLDDGFGRTVAEAARTAFDRAVGDLLDERGASLDGGDAGGAGGTDGPTSLDALDDPDLLDLLLAANRTADPVNRLSRAELRDDLVTFLFAGHETTALALTYAGHLLAANPATADRLAAEVDDLDGDPTVADLPDLPYTEAIVKESLRRYPPLYTLFREPLEPVVLDGCRVPAGATLVLPQRIVHTDPRWWDEPLTFRPERWRDGEGGAVADGDDHPEYAYFPFGGGKRHCIGARFAMLEARLALATLARRWRFTEPGDLRPSLAVTLQPEAPVRLTVRRR